MTEKEDKTQSKGGCFHLDGRSLDEVSPIEISRVRNPCETNCRACKIQLACSLIPYVPLKLMPMSASA